MPPQALGIPLLGLTETIILYQSVGSIASMADDGTMAFKVPMEATLLSYINRDFYPRGRFVTLSVACPAGAIRLVLRDIQQRLVGFLSEINQLSPTSTNVVRPSPEQSVEVTKSVEKHQMNIGSVDTLIMTSGQVNIDRTSILPQQISIGSWPALQGYLAEQKVPEGRITEVKEILDEVERIGESGDAGKKLEGWFRKTTEEMTNTLGGATKEASKKLLTETLYEGMKKYAPNVVKWGAAIAAGLM